MTDAMTPGGTTERGWVQSTRIGDLLVTYRTGKDAPQTLPVFDMSVGTITAENVGTKVVNLKYSVPDVYFSGHRFEFGDAQQKSFSHPHVHWPGPEDAMDFDCAPGVVALLSRQDFMGLFERLGRAHFLDGTVRTRFEGLVLIDDRPHTLTFGPHIFQVDLERDWAEEEARYLEFFAARDRGEIPP